MVTHSRRGPRGVGGQKQVVFPFWWDLKRNKIEKGPEEITVEASKGTSISSDEGEEPRMSGEVLVSFFISEEVESLGFRGLRVLGP